MPSNSPNVEAPLWDAAQASPWTPHNKALRIFDAFAVAVIIDEMDLASPPVTCNDGGRYLVQGTATDDWLGHEGELAIAVGSNASGGWIFAQVAVEGMVITNRDDGLRYRYTSGVWEPFTDAVSRMGDLLDVDLTGLADGHILRWDASNGFWYPSIDIDTNTGGGGGTGSAWSKEWGPLDNEPPATNFATFDTRNSRAVLDFDTTTQEAAIFSGVLPTDYAGGGITVSIWCSLTSATSGTVGWDVSLERVDASGLDTDTDSFATAQTVTATTVPGTSGQVLKMSVNISDGANMDSLAAGELFRIRIRRDVANDTAAGDAEVHRVMMVEQ